MNRTVLNLITSVAVVAVFNDVDRMLKAFIGPELEKKLRRPLTEWDWQIYRQEKANRDQYTAWNDYLTQRQRWIIDMQVIHDFVWR
ncbi:hypothetical protein [Dehalococcoides mccartyi]|uniref:hypothetical protein n=1 Tax=Dehalococcoides mccartyi TaxID=61435 RepID=UPI0003C813AD|nr:hypothetical protein [Dehalococcoides mccartyi]AHB13465.1 hypothetical protein GY50_0684 [Dehalococcoides mccartyi GY50]